MLSAELEGNDFYTFTDIRFVTWNRESELLAEKGWDDDVLQSALVDVAWDLHNQHEGYGDDGAVMGLHKAIGEGIIEGFKKYFNVKLKGDAEKIGEEIFISDDAIPGGVEIKLDDETLAEWLIEYKYPNVKKGDSFDEFVGDVLGYFGDDYNGTITVESVLAVYETEMDFEFDGEEFEEETVVIHGKAVLYEDVKEYVIKQFEDWADEIEDIDPKDYQ